MLWKAGCLTVLAGIVLTLGSCAFFGSAINRAQQVRQVKSVAVEAGRTTETLPITAETGTHASVRVEAEIELTEQTVAAVGDNGTILQVSVPVNYEVKNESGTQIHLEAARLSGSEIVPRRDSPHYDSFSRRVRVSFDGSRFPVPDSDQLIVLVDLPKEDEEANPILRGRVIVSDRVPTSTGRWVAGGFASMVLGPIVAVIGFIVFVVGLFARHSSKIRVPPVV